MGGVAREGTSQPRDDTSVACLLGQTQLGSISPCVGGEIRMYVLDFPLTPLSVCLGPTTTPKLTVLTYCLLSNQALLQNNRFPSDRYESARRVDGFQHILSYPHELVHTPSSKCELHSRAGNELSWPALLRPPKALARTSSPPLPESVSALSLGTLQPMNKGLASPREA